MKRRYSEFLVLRDVLALSVPATSRVEAPFPPKRLIVEPCSLAPGGKHSPAVVKERIAGLGAWLQQVSQVEGALTSPAAQDFLEKSSA